MQSVFSLICDRNSVLNDYKNINLDIICYQKHIGHEIFCTMALLLSSDKNNPKTGMNLI